MHVFFIKKCEKRKHIRNFYLFVLKKNIFIWKLWTSWFMSEYMFLYIWFIHLIKKKNEKKMYHQKQILSWHLDMFIHKIKLLDCQAISFLTSGMCSHLSIYKSICIFLWYMYVCMYVCMYKRTWLHSFIINQKVESKWKYLCPLRKVLKENEIRGPIYSKFSDYYSRF